MLPAGGIRLEHGLISVCISGGGSLSEQAYRTVVYGRLSETCMDALNVSLHFSKDIYIGLISLVPSGGGAHRLLG